MPNDNFRYALEMFRNDGDPAGQFPVEIDWEPIRQWMRFVAIRHGRQWENRFPASPVRPCWDEVLGKPHVSGFQTVDCGSDDEIGPAVVPIRYLAPQARALADRLVDGGELEDGTYSFRVLAYPVTDPESVPFSMAIETVDTDPPLSSGDLADLVPRAIRHGEPIGTDIPVFVPRGVLDECRELTTAADGRETGGILIGDLKRDMAGGDIFLSVTAQIAARYTVAEETRLAFTPETWTQVQGAIDLRQRDEIMLGWWHSHPIKAWCRKCPSEKRKKCPLLIDYFSAQDRLLHRTVFPAAYSLALVVNELAADKRTISMFGWRQGLVVQRGFQELDDTRQVAPGRGSVSTREDVR